MLTTVRSEKWKLPVKVGLQYLTMMEVRRLVWEWHNMTGVDVSTLKVSTSTFYFASFIA